MYRADHVYYHVHNEYPPEERSHGLFTDITGGLASIRRPMAHSDRQASQASLWTGRPCIQSTSRKYWSKYDFHGTKTAWIIPKLCMSEPYTFINVCMYLQNMWCYYNIHIQINHFPLAKSPVLDLYTENFKFITTIICNFLCGQALLYPNPIYIYIYIYFPAKEHTSSHISQPPQLSISSGSWNIAVLEGLSWPNLLYQ